MSLAAPPVHAYITQSPSICDGEPIISGTRITVRAIVHYILFHGMTAEELVKEFPHINLSQVYDALSYYYDHKAEIESLIAENSKLR
mgnify:CR=1 FL=1